MSVEAGATSNGDASASLFEDRRFQASSIPVAVELLLITIDQCRHMLQVSKSEDASFSSMRKQYDDLLTVRERRILDAAVAAFWDDFTGKARRELERLGLISEQAKADDLIYPLAQETAFTFTDILLRQIKDDALHRHFDAYRGDEIKIEYIMASIRIGTKSERESTLGGALLCLAVSKIEEFVGALVRVGLTLHPNILGELPSVPDSVITRYRTNVSSSGLRRWQIDQNAANLLKGSPNEWQSSLEKRLGVDIAAVGGNWPIITEMIQRRHAIVHNNGRADDEYMTKVVPHLTFGLEPGSALMCDSSYMMPVLVELETWAICVALYWAKNFFKSDAQYYPGIISRVVGLERDGRWTQALAILNALLREPLPADSEQISASLAQINRWFCLQELGHDNESLKREIKTWMPPRLDPQDLFRIDVGRAALLRDSDKLIKLFRHGIGSETLGVQKKYFREMPLMQRAMGESVPLVRLLQGAEINRVRKTSVPTRRGRGKSRR